MTFRKRNILFALLIVPLSGCGNFPERETRRMDRLFPPGVEAVILRNDMKRRGFHRDARFETHFPDDQIAARREWVKIFGSFDASRAQIGFRKISGDPTGEWECYSRAYTYVVARGENFVCFTTDRDDYLRWRQASFVGASL